MTKHSEYLKQWRLDNPDKTKKYNENRSEEKHKWYLKNRDRIQEKKKEPENKKRIANQIKLWKEKNRDKCHKYCREYREKLTKKVIEHYGGKCECCGETNFLFLTIDHIKRNGKEERRKLGSNNLSIYRKIILENYPEGYRVLCYNCNCGRERNNGVCPHKKLTAFM